MSRSSSLSFRKSVATAGGRGSTSRSLSRRNAAQSPARIVDLSYGGVRLEVADVGAAAPELGSGLRVNLPAFGVSIDTALVWVERSPSGFLHCGAAVDRLSPAVTTAWRQVVDRVGFSVQ